MGRRVRVVRGLAIRWFVLASLLVGSAIATVASADVAAAQSVSSIVVEGNRRVEADTVRSYFKPGPRGQLDAASIDTALKALYGTGLFQDVRINHVGGRLVVTVVENPVINRVAFEGNKKAKDAQLTSEIQSKPRGTLSRPTVQADVQRIVEIYHRSGRYDVTVVPKIIELPNNRVDLVFEINEGPKTGVKKIIFVGNRAYSTQRLKDVIKTSESNWLSFLQTTDIYDTDRIQADRDLLRKFYLSHGYADIRIVSAVGEYDPAQKGFTITYTIDEGAQYHVGTVDVVSNVQAVDPNIVRSRLRMKPGDVYNADLVEKSVEGMTIEVAKRGYAFATVHPRGDRNFETKKINLVFVVEEGARAYIERINIRGNVRTRDYVIRREFDIGEGDAYNQALINRAERRLKNLNFFKKVKITTEPGSAPDRVVVNVDVDEMATGEFSIGGGYSTTDGFLAEVSVAERNLFGRGQLARASVQYGQYARGVQLSFVEPYLMGYRLAGGIDLFYKETLANSYLSYNTKTVGTTLKVGIPITEEFSITPRYSIYQQKITLPEILNNCIATQAANQFQKGIGPGVQPSNDCFQDGEASLPIRIELSRGATLTSLVGYTLAYNTLDDNKNPTSGFYGELNQDIAGLGGDVNFIRTTGDLRNYYEVFPDVVSLVRLQGGHITSWGSKDLRALDMFQMGPNLVRGFAPAGFGPRDLTSPTQDALGGTLYWGSTLEFQTPLYFLPKEVGVKMAVFADAGSLWDYTGPTFWSRTGERLNVGDSKSVRSSVGVGLIWDSPLGPLRFDFGFPLTKESYDHTQWFRFSGGTTF
ncbi:MAG TPA: outer membrane protein assembly factor BamA [Pseudolabrys sp.]|nr:outer membrane protein assembly factor BamA [Pseudolabrys sp.]